VAAKLDRSQRLSLSAVDLLEVRRHDAGGHVPPFAGDRLEQLLDTGHQIYVVLGALCARGPAMGDVDVLLTDDVQDVGDVRQQARLYAQLARMLHCLAEPGLEGGPLRRGSALGLRSLLLGLNEHPAHTLQEAAVGRRQIGPQTHGIQVFATFVHGGRGKLLKPVQQVDVVVEALFRRGARHRRALH
jgi:hypothetical protein